MLSSGLIEFLLYLLVPVVLVNFLRGRQSKDSSFARKRRLVRADYLFYASLALLAAGYFASVSFWQPPNVFKRINASPLSSCDALRERLAAYAESYPEIAPPGGIPSENSKLASSFARLEYYQASEYGRMDFLIDRFCAYDADRDAYLKFGEHAFLGSIFSDFGSRGTSPRTKNKAQKGIAPGFADIGFMLYMAATQAFTYLPAFVLVGLLTTSLTATDFAPSRVYLRPWGVIMLGTLYCADIYCLCVVPTLTKQRLGGVSTLWIVSPDSTDPAAFYADATEYTRGLFLAASLAAFMCMDYLTSSRQTDIQLLKMCLDEQSDMLAASKNHTVLETAVLLSSRLRERLVAQWRREEEVRAELFADSSFAQKYDRAALESKSKQWIESNAPAALRSFGIDA
ncbi:hypothetical protein LPJ61_001594 [Coemansia biformis]|uniref:Uncharacterized protein n=1 Tax=Coemansia biformis TaxID=1286918 RepID=A0A9W7YG36_9FUNG|nr:hypothetical protein LPJ61_001594 [Coemansia biformis]